MIYSVTLVDGISRIKNPWKLYNRSDCWEFKAQWTFPRERLCTELLKGTMSAILVLNTLKSQKLHSHQRKPVTNSLVLYSPRSNEKRTSHPAVCALKICISSKRLRSEVRKNALLEIE